VKTCTLRRNASGNWLVSFSCEVKVEPKAITQEALGIDVGLENFATFSDGRKIENPRFFKMGEKTLAKAQRKLSKLEKGSQERKKQRSI
jgi:putative transposase